MDGDHRHCPKPAVSRSSDRLGDAGAKPSALDQQLERVCDEQGLLRSDYPQVKQLLSMPREQWPECCDTGCHPCVKDHQRVAEYLLQLGRAPVALTERGSAMRTGPTSWRV